MLAPALFPGRHVPNAMSNGYQKEINRRRTFAIISHPDVSTHDGGGHLFYLAPNQWGLDFAMKQRPEISFFFRSTIRETNLR